MVAALYSRVLRPRYALIWAAFFNFIAFSPAAIDIAPAVSPATPAINTALGEGSAAATPTINDEMDTIPSFAPNTAARSQPLRVMK